MDETQLDGGQLNDRGVRSVSAIQSIAVAQQLPMSYPYYELKVPTDLPMIMFTSAQKGACLSGSEALKIVLQSDSTFPSNEQNGTYEHTHGQGPMDQSEEFKEYSPENYAENSAEHPEEYSESDEVWRERARTWWASVRTHDVTMKESVAVSGVESFATARQTDSRLTQGDFHRWLTVSRLLALSEGCLEITAGHWERMREMEGRRLDRYFTCYPLNL